MRKIAKIQAAHCLCFMSPGPPWYAAQCRLEAGHSGECLFCSMEEAGKLWRKSTDADSLNDFLSTPQRDDAKHPEFWERIVARLCARQESLTEEIKRLKQDMRHARRRLKEIRATLERSTNQNTER